MGRVFIIHGWGGHPDEAWFPSVKRELEERGFEVEIPTMPDVDGNPEIESRVNFLKDFVGVPDEDIHFIGHSIGCQTIARYLETLPAETRVGGAVFVAGWFTLKDLDDYEEEDRQVAMPWIETPIDYEKVRSICPKSVAIFTKDDPFVDIGNARFYEERFGSKIITLESGGHLNDESNTKALPQVIIAMEEINK
jgi:uncharacterized protein